MPTKKRRRRDAPFYTDGTNAARIRLRPDTGGLAVYTAKSGTIGRIRKLKDGRWSWRLIYGVARGHASSRAAAVRAVLATPTTPKIQPGHTADCSGCLSRPGDGARRMYHTMEAPPQAPLVPGLLVDDPLTVHMKGVPFAVQVTDWTPDRIVAWVRAEMAEIEADARHRYEPADVFVNAPLALIQVELSARMGVLKKVLELLGGEAV